jgi:hypothetical protein
MHEESGNWLLETVDFFVFLQGETAKWHNLSDDKY